MVVDYLTSNYKTVYSTPEFSKTGQIIARRIYYSDHGVLQYSSFAFSFFISAESLKNHNKSQKIIKIENIILLDST
jgi:hypothetical protein